MEHFGAVLKQVIKHRIRIGALILLAVVPVIHPAKSVAFPLDQLTDLTGKAQIIVTLTGRDNFASEYRYDIVVRNQTADPLIADSLVVVLEKITNLAGEEREPLKNETILSQFEVLGQDGETDDGKPFFHVPVGTSADLLPQTESRAVSVRLRNKDYLSIFTPVFRVYGTRRPPPEPKAPSVQTQPGAPQHQAEKQMDKLIQLLLKKGVITEEEWRKATQP